MSDKVRIVLHIDPDAAAILDDTVTPRQKGVYISKLLRDAQRQTERGDAGILERMERKLDKLIERG